jgi:hypothetical protein
MQISREKHCFSLWEIKQVQWPYDGQMLGMLQKYQETNIEEEEKFKQLMNY